jgi:hypothetical protein
MNALRYPVKTISQGLTDYLNPAGKDLSARHALVFTRCGNIADVHVGEHQHINALFSHMQADQRLRVQS